MNWFDTFNETQVFAGQREGWDEDWAAEFSLYAGAGLLPGRVARVDRGMCTVVVAEGDATAVGGQHLKCVVVGSAGALVVQFTAAGPWLTGSDRTVQVVADP